MDPQLAGAWGVRPPPPGLTLGTGVARGALQDVVRARPELQPRRGCGGPARCPPALGSGGVLLLGTWGARRLVVGSAEHFPEMPS